MDNIIYLDNAATTSTRPEVLDAMLPYFSLEYGNPSSIYSIGQHAKVAVDKARETIANTLNVDSNEIYFTAGGSESDNWALIATCEAYASKGKHIITSAVEHHAVLHTCKYLEQKGYEVTYIGVDEYGVVNLEELKAVIRDDTILISIMYANNEIGTIMPIKEIGELAKCRGILFHTDAVQAYGHIPIDIKGCNIDMLSASAHKIYGPKGIGFLYMRKGIKNRSYIYGGQQERGKRAGTENVPAIVGYAKAAALAYEDMDKEMNRLTKLRDNTIAKIAEEIPHCMLNGHPINRLPNNINYSFAFIEGEGMLMMLDMKGICASSGSACTSGSLDPSHVLLATGMPHELAHGSLRLTMNADTTQGDMDRVVETLKNIISRLRDMSPLYEDYIANNK